MPLSFHEAFVASDEQRALLMHRLHVLYDTVWKDQFVAVQVDRYPMTAPGGYVKNLDQAVAMWAAEVGQCYAIAQSAMAQHTERLLLMQALCEELKSETRELVARCVSFEELDRSMLASV
jgi:hypothetical protein